MFTSFEKSIPYLGVFLRVLVGLAAVVSALVVMLAMYTTITERTREIGILKAMGASRGYIVGVIEKEAILISFIGLIAGICRVADRGLFHSPDVRTHLRIQLAVGTSGGGDRTYRRRVRRVVSGVARFESRCSKCARVRVTLHGLDAIGFVVFALPLTGCASENPRFQIRITP